MISPGREKNKVSITCGWMAPWLPGWMGLWMRQWFTAFVMIRVIVVSNNSPNGSSAVSDIDYEAWSLGPLPLKRFHYENKWCMVESTDDRPLIEQAFARLRSEKAFIWASRPRSTGRVRNAVSWNIANIVWSNYIKKELEMEELFCIGRQKTERLSYTPNRSWKGLRNRQSVPTLFPYVTTMKSQMCIWRMMISLFTVGMVITRGQCSGYLRL